MNDVCKQLLLQMWIEYIEIFGVLKVFSFFLSVRYQTQAPYNCQFRGILLYSPFN